MKSPEDDPNFHLGRVAGLMGEKFPTTVHFFNKLVNEHADLVMLLRSYCATGSLAARDKAMKYLKEHGLQGSVLRKEGKV